MCNKKTNNIDIQNIYLKYQRYTMMDENLSTYQ